MQLIVFGTALKNEGAQALHKKLHQFVCQYSFMQFHDKSSIQIIDNTQCLMELLLLDQLYIPFGDLLDLYMHYFKRDDTPAKMERRFCQQTLKMPKYSNYFCPENLGHITQILQEKKLDTDAIQFLTSAIISKPPNPPDHKINFPQHWPTKNLL